MGNKNDSAVRKRTTPSVDPSQRGVIMALIIGNSEYNKSSKLDPLNQPKNDA